MKFYDKPKNVMGIESFLWDVLIDADYEMTHANYYVVGVDLNIARLNMNGGTDDDLRNHYKEIYGRYVKKHAN